MEQININIKHAIDLVGREAYEAVKPEVEAAKRHLVNGDAAGNDFLGWVDLPENRCRRHHR